MIADTLAALIEQLSNTDALDAKLAHLEADFDDAVATGVAKWNESYDAKVARFNEKYNDALDDIKHYHHKIFNKFAADLKKQLWSFEKKAAKLDKEFEWAIDTLVKDF